MLHLINEPLRSEAQYRITFDTATSKNAHDTAARVRDILLAFNSLIVEVRIMTHEFALFVTIPRDIPPEALDKKAEALRATWRERDKIGKPVDWMRDAAAAGTLVTKG